MQRHQLEHVVGAAANVVEEDEFAREAIAAGLVEGEVLLGRIDHMPIGEGHRSQIRHSLTQLLDQAAGATSSGPEGA